MHTYFAFSKRIKYYLFGKHNQNVAQKHRKTTMTLTHPHTYTRTNYGLVEKSEDEKRQNSEEEKKEKRIKRRNAEAVQTKRRWRQKKIFRL